MDQEPYEPFDEEEREALELLAHSHPKYKELEALVMAINHTLNTFRCAYKDKAKGIPITEEDESEALALLEKALGECEVTDAILGLYLDKFMVSEEIAEEDIK